MKILFTNSPLHFTHGHTFTQPDWQTLVLPLLAAIVGERHEIRLVDNMSHFFKSNNVMHQVEQFQPDIIGFSIIAARDIFNTIRIIGHVREKYPNKVLIAGGQAATFYDELLLTSGINFVVRGEAEVTLCELVECLENKTDDFSKIAGLSFIKSGSPHRTSDRIKISTLDDSPMPLIHLMPAVKSRWFPGRLTGSMETSRGCPFTCNFCAITSFWEGSFRRKSNDRIIEEFKFLSRYGRTHIYLADDNFGMGEEKHVDLFERILREGIDVRLFAQMRTDSIAMHPEMVRLAARAGLYGALIGFDTYDADTFHHVAKVGSLELNIKCAETLKANNIIIFGSHIYALPSQNKPTDFATTFWQGRKNSDLFRMPHFSLLPGTKLYGNLVTQETIDSKQGSDDYRLLIRSASEQKKFKRWYTFFNFLHILLPDEMLKALFHPNKNVRTLKRYGYIGILRHQFYRIIRRFGLCDI